MAGADVLQEAAVLGEAEVDAVEDLVEVARAGELGLRAAAACGSLVGRHVGAMPICLCAEHFWEVRSWGRLDCVLDANDVVGGEKVVVASV